ncbi:LysR substrate-binding domain-containing protein [Pseudomonas batumici]|uniref:LysR substrate-binding domain-containing protein n=1 Tax=Pseudomonas batumici TaxID=226910 RepID=UPI0030CEE214
MSRLPPLRALQVFETVGHCGGISHAAKRLNLSVGAVSQQMKLLEEALGMNLTVKEGQRLRLNAIGLRFHARCSSAFEELRAAVFEVERSKNPNNLYVSGLPSLMTKWLAPLTYEWQHEHADLDIYLDSTLADTSEEENADFRIGYGEPGQYAEHSVVLFRDCVVPACSPTLLALPGYPGGVEQAADLLQYPLIRIDSRPKFDSPPSWAEWFEREGVAVEQAIVIRRSFSSSSLAIQAAIDHQGVVLAQFSMIARDVDEGRLVIPWQRAMPLPSPYYLSWHPNTLQKAQCRAFQRWLIGRGRAQEEITDALMVSL